MSAAREREKIIVLLLFAAAASIVVAVLAAAAAIHCYIGNNVAHTPRCSFQKTEKNKTNQTTQTKQSIRRWLEKLVFPLCSWQFSLRIFLAFRAENKQQVT